MTRALFAPFSDARFGVIRALVHEHGHLPVTLHREPDNRADPGAVAVVSSLPLFVVGGQPVYNAANERIGQRIGYVARMDAGKRGLAARLDAQDATRLLAGCLSTHPGMRRALQQQAKNLLTT